MQLVSEDSPAAGLRALAEREAAALIVIGSSHRSGLAWAAELAHGASARLRVLSVYERTLPASLAVGGGRSRRCWAASNARLTSWPTLPWR
jgi:hypothetical protein